MEQVKALNALEPFVALTKSASSARAAADLITRATSTPGTYVFTELLQSPQIQALSQAPPEQAAYLTLLEIFSYGTYATHQTTAAQAGLPALNDQQALKLRQLSLLTIAREPAHLSYATLQAQLGLSDARALEDLVISAIYAGLLDAQLDPHNQTVRVSSVSPLRDLAPGSVPGLLSNLEAWSERCTSTLDDLEAQVAAIKATATQRHADKKAWEATTEKLLEDEKEKGKDPLAGGGGGVHGPNQRGIISRAVARLGGAGGARGKRGMDPEVEDDEAMDLDDEEVDDGVEGKKRASRRKL